MTATTTPRLQWTKVRAGLYRTTDGRWEVEDMEWGYGDRGWAARDLHAPTMRDEMVTSYPRQTMREAREVVEAELAREATR